MQMDKHSFVLNLAATLNIHYTQEQYDLAENFTRTTMCFASPGTGKTMTAIAGLITAELYDQIPGNNIYAMSFTKMATGELSVRHYKACKTLGIRQTVNFQTLHSLCTTLLKENSRLLNMNNLEIRDDLSMANMVNLISTTCQQWGVTLDVKRIPGIVRAIKALNSSLTFDENHVKEDVNFKKAHCDYDLFMRIRSLLFMMSLNTEQIQVSDILLYTLLLLTNHPEVSAKFKSQCKLMLVDEAQDLSLLQLRIISLLADTVIFIGDIKQQIYAFNGACQEVVTQFFKLYPGATTCQLTQSFRCYNKIANFATSIILKNALDTDTMESMSFSGVKEGGIVELSNEFNLTSVVEDLSRSYNENNRNFTKDYLFLFRNNASSIPIAEILYKNRLPFRVNNYMEAYRIPVIKDLANICFLAKSPNQPLYVAALKPFISEFAAYSDIHLNPLYKIMSQTDKSIFEINYQYQNPNEAQEAMDLLVDLHNMIKEGRTVQDLFNRIYPLYNNMWLRSHAFMLEYTPDYYIRLVNGLIRGKTFDQFVQDEDEKVLWIKNYNELIKGIRCYTMHASKGLEADIVYILDAEQGIIPNLSKLKKMTDMGCDFAAAREIRNERSLCYVAVTRAKEACYIQYTKELSSIFQNDTMFDYYDDLYKNGKKEENDIEAFNEFVRDFRND